MILNSPILKSVQSDTSNLQNLQKTFATSQESNISTILNRDKIALGLVNSVLSMRIVRVDVVQQWNLMVSKDAVSTAMMSSATHFSQTLEDH